MVNLCTLSMLQNLWGTSPRDSVKVHIAEKFVESGFELRCLEQTLTHAW